MTAGKIRYGSRVMGDDREGVTLLFCLDMGC